MRAPQRLVLCAQRFTVEEIERPHLFYDSIDQPQLLKRAQAEGGPEQERARGAADEQIRTLSTHTFRTRYRSWAYPVHEPVDVILLGKPNEIGVYLMVDHITVRMSESEEMYLVWIARILEAGAAGPVPISLLADQMQIQPVSVNQMVHKLETLDFVQYTPYQGVRLTAAGMKYAQDILHRRRLWEVFLVEHLHLTLEQADELACRMEHIFPTEALSRLDDFLGHPSRSPSDKRIPRTQEPDIHQNAYALETLELGCRGEVITIDLDHATRTFLKSEGLQPGSNVEVLALGSSGGMLISTDAGSKLNLSPDLSRRIWVQDIHR